MKRPPSRAYPLGGGLDATLDHPGLHPMIDDTVKLDGLEIHELALAFPVYGKEDSEKLTNDIRNHGMRLPVMLFEGKSSMAATDWRRPRRPDGPPFPRKSTREPTSKHATMSYRLTSSAVISTPDSGP
jgi:hypothetical protein